MNSRQFVRGFCRRCGNPPVADATTPFIAGGAESPGGCAATPFVKGAESPGGCAATPFVKGAESPGGCAATPFVKGAESPGGFAATPFVKGAGRCPPDKGGGP